MTTAILTTEKFGDISVAEDAGAIISVRFVPRTLSSARRMKGDCTKEAVELLAEAMAQMAAYFEGRLRVFDVPVRHGAQSQFQRLIWDFALTIPYGKTVTYRELATGIGNTDAVRAAGRVLNKNPVALLVPCHRVISSDGTPGGYAFGMPMKTALLRLEAENMHAGKNGG